MATTNTQLMKEVREINKRLDALLLAESARLEREKKNDDLIVAHEGALNGNGKQGLKTDVQLLKDAQGRVNWVSAIFTTAVILDLASRVLAK